MIRISQIDDELSIYKKNIVSLIGIGVSTQQLINLMRYHGIEISCIFSNNENQWHTIYEGILVLPPQYLPNFIEKNKYVTIQIADRNNIFITEEELKILGVCEIIPYDEAWQMLNFINKLSLLNKNTHLIQSYEPVSVGIRALNKKIEAFEYIYQNSHLKEYLFICMIPKTGDDTLGRTFRANNIPHFYALHTPEILDKKLIASLNKKVKVILGIREPISQNLSFLYHSVAGISDMYYAYHLNENSKTFFKDGVDAQNLFDIAYDNILERNDNIVSREASSNYISEFINRFEENILDITKYEFDKEKGYSILKEGNLEVFVYQIEKMNNIINEMSNWIGGAKFDKWVMGNEASSKWISNSYKQSQKEISFSKEYFENNYNADWLKHFYSDKDIELFKKRWETHIKGYVTNIVFICEDENIKQLSIALISALENSLPITNYNVYIIHKFEYTQENIDMIYELNNKYNNFNINFIKNEKVYNTSCETIAQTISNLIIEIDKCIYLDYNVVVQKDLGDLYKIDISLFGIGAVNEIEDNFNSSVLIINLINIRNNQNKVTPIDLKFNFKSDYIYLEKNFNFNNKIQMNPMLTKKFGVKNLKYALQENVIFSYTDEVNPLNNAECSFSNIWWKYFRKSPFSKQKKLANVNPKVSVIISVYNASNFLSECLDSVINQTLDEIEIICVDDGSTDDSLDILKEYSNIDDRIIIIEKVNDGLGAAGARNLGIENSKGDYLVILDCDDFFELTLLEETYCNALENDSDIVVYNYFFFNNELDKFNFGTYYKLTEFDKVISYKDIPDKIFTSFFHTTWTKLYKSEFVKFNNIKFPQIYRTDDICFVNLSLILAERISVINKPLVHYRMGISSQTTSSKFPLSFVDSWAYLKDKLTTLFIYDVVEPSFLNSMLGSAIYLLGVMENTEGFEIIYNYIASKLNYDFNLDNFLNRIYPTHFRVKYELIKNTPIDEYAQKNGIKYNSQSSKIKISVIIPIYNAEDFLYDSIESILKQTLKEIEIICVDDGSTDRTHEILNELAQKNKNIKIVTQKNQLVFSARNNGLKTAIGEYVYFFDQDDLLYDNYVLENMFTIAEYNNVDILRGRSVTFDNETKNLIQNNNISLKNIDNSKFNKILNFIDDYPFLLQTSVVVWGGIFKRDFLIDNNITFPNLISCEDAAFFLESIIKSKKIMIADIYITKYRINNKNSLINSRFNNFKDLFKLYHLAEILCKDLPKEIIIYTLESRLNIPLYWLFQGEDNLNFQLNLDLTNDFFANINYIYWGKKENNLVYCDFRKYYFKNKKN